MADEKSDKKSKKRKQEKESQKISQEKKKFLPVHKKDAKKAIDLPITAVANSTLEVEPDSVHPNRPIIMIKQKDDQNIYYAHPLSFGKYIDDKSFLEKINTQAVENLREFKKIWVKLGTSILLVQATHSYKIKYNTFEEFCEKELHLHRSTAYEIISSTLFLMHEQKELYENLMNNEVNESQIIPSYHSVYLIAKKKKKFDQEKYREILKSLFNGELSTEDLKDKIKEILPVASSSSKKGTGKKPSWQTFIRDFENISKRIDNFHIDQKIKSEIQKLFEKLSKIKDSKASE